MAKYSSKSEKPVTPRRWHSVGTCWNCWYWEYGDLCSPKTNMTGWKIHHEWIYISYWTWGFANVMLLFRGVCPFHPPFPKTPHWAGGNKVSGIFSTTLDRYSGENFQSCLTSGWWNLRSKLEHMTIELMDVLVGWNMILHSPSYLVLQRNMAKLIMPWYWVLVVAIILARTVVIRLMLRMMVVVVMMVILTIVVISN